MGMMATNGLGSADKSGAVDTSVKPDEVIAKVASKEEKKQSTSLNKQKSSVKSELSNDPNQIYYERVANAIIKFVEQYSKGRENLDRDKVIRLTRENAEKYSDGAVVTAFASGLADTFEKATTAKPIIDRVVKVPTTQPQSTGTQEENQASEYGNIDEPPFKESPIAVVNDILSTYRITFAEKQNSKESEKMKAIAEDAARKADAMMKLYIAGGAFGSFLFLVFISIVVKIERNLRGLKITHE